MEYNQQGQLRGCTVIEPISRGRFIVEHYIMLLSDNAYINQWYLDKLIVLNRDELDRIMRQSSTVDRDTTMTDVVVYTSLYNINRNTSLKQLQLVGNEKKMCIVCMENIQPGQIIREINKCHHQYHQLCFDKWAETNYRCPLCNLDFTLTE